MPRRTWICDACRTVLRLSAPARPWTDALSGRLLAAGLGERDAVHPARGRARAGVRSAVTGDPPAQSGPAGVSGRGAAAQSAARCDPASISGFAATRTQFRSIFCAPAAKFKFPSFFRPDSVRRHGTSAARLHVGHSSVIRVRGGLMRDRHRVAMAVVTVAVLCIAAALSMAENAAGLPGRLDRPRNPAAVPSSAPPAVTILDSHEVAGHARARSAQRRQRGHGPRRRCLRGQHGTSPRRDHRLRRLSRRRQPQDRGRLECAALRSRSGQE